MSTNTQPWPAPIWSFPELSSQENSIITDARLRGYAAFYPSFPSAKAQAENTLAGARAFLEGQESAAREQA